MPSAPGASISATHLIFQNNSSKPRGDSSAKRLSVPRRSTRGVCVSKSCSE